MLVIYNQFTIVGNTVVDIGNLEEFVVIDMQLQLLSQS